MRQSVIFTGLFLLSVILCGQNQSLEYGDYYLYTRPLIMNAYTYDQGNLVPGATHTFKYDASQNIIEDDQTLTTTSGGNTTTVKFRNLFEYNAARQLTKATAQSYNSSTNSYNTEVVEVWKYDAFGIDTAYENTSYSSGTPGVVDGYKRMIIRDGSQKVQSVTYFTLSNASSVPTYQEMSRNLYHYSTASGQIDTIFIYSYDPVAKQVLLNEKRYGLSFEVYNDTDFRKLILKTYKAYNAVTGDITEFTFTFDTQHRPTTETLSQSGVSNLDYTWTYFADSTVMVQRQKNTSDAWDNVQKTVFHYDQLDTLSGTTVYGFSNSHWTLQSDERYLRTFDGQGRITEEIHQFYNINTAAWESKQRYTFDYVIAAIASGIQVPRVLLFPNPTPEAVQLSDLTQVDAVMVITPTGQVHYIEDFSRIDLPGEPGIYFLKIRFKNQTDYTYKINKI